MEGAVCLLFNIMSLPGRKTPQSHLITGLVAEKFLPLATCVLSSMPEKKEGAGRLPRSALVSSLGALTVSEAFPNMALTHFIGLCLSLRQVYSPCQKH